MAGTRLRGGFDQGWLTFESTGTTENLRRLVPIPADWESAPDERLEVLCRTADEVTRPTHVRDRQPTVERPDQG